MTPTSSTLIKLPGMTVVHHDTDLLGNIMGWGEWMGIPGDDLKATHVEGFITPIEIAKMNPAVSSLYPASQAPWASCSILAFKPLTLKDGSTVDPHTDQVFTTALAQEIMHNIGEPYDWGQIKEFSFEGFLARFDPKAALTDEAKAYVINAAAGHFGVCSEWWEARLENAILATYGLSIDLFAGTKVGHDHARPADWILSPYLYLAASPG